MHVSRLKLTLILTVLLSASFIQVSGQTTKNWRNLAAAGANYYDIKAAFMSENAARLEEMKAVMQEQAAGAGNEEEEGEFFELIQFMRWSEWVEPRVTETKGDLQLMDERYQKALLAIFNKPKSVGQQGADNWTLIGPITQSNNTFGNGRVNNVRIDPNNQNIMYACTPASQLFKSINGGVSWVSISDKLPAIGVTDVAIDPSAPNTLYAITGDGDRSLYHPLSSGLFKTTNGGSTWTATGLSFTQGQFLLLTSVVVDPSNPNVILVSGSKGIYRSTDSGVSFTLTSSENARDLVFMPGNSNIVFTGSNNRQGAAKFLRSNDNGLTWTAITNGISTNGKRFAIDVSPANPNMVYVMTTNSYDKIQGVYCSVDAGLSFKLMSVPSNLAGNDTYGQGWYDLCLAADPNKPSNVYIGGVDIYKSVDSGKNWTNTTRVYNYPPAPNTHPDVHDLTFSANGTLYVGNDGGVYKSTDAALNYSNISSNLAIAQPYGIGMSSTNPKLIISGHQDNGSNLTTDKLNWKQILGADGMLCMIDRTNDNIMYASQQNSYLFRSNNGGLNFTIIVNGISGSRWVTPMLQDRRDPATIYAASTRVFKSVNSGTNWVLISPDYGSIAGIDVDRNDNNVMFAASVYTGTFYGLNKTIDGGLNWTRIGLNALGASSLACIHIDVNNSNTIYAGTSSYVGNNLYRSLDGGATWELWSTGLPSLPVNTIITQSGEPGEIYCGTDHGVYYRNAGSNTWLPYNTNLPPVPVRDLKIFYPNSQLRAATFGRGIWETPLAVSVSCPVPLVSNIYNRVYVNSGAKGTNTGESWANAFTRLNTALSNTSRCGLSEVWVAGGTYYPVATGAGADRAVYFTGRNNLAIYGGFAGTETDRSQRNLALGNASILSGDIQKDNNTANNAYNVFFASDLDSTFVLDGFTLQGGNANLVGNPLNSRGAGINISGGNPVIRNCIITNNQAVSGAGIYTTNATPNFINCVVTSNTHTLSNGAVWNLDASPSFINCTIANNKIEQTNDSIVIQNTGNASPVITNSIVYGTKPALRGGTPVVSYSIIQNGSVWPGTGNSKADPLFINAAGGDLRLQPCSPAIDAGITTLFANDIKGVQRPKGTAFDIGAYERQQATNLYVDATAPLNGDGSAWMAAYRSFYEALQVYNGCTTIDSILVAAGTYAAPGGNAFKVNKNGVILGGYPAGGGNRNPALYPVIIKGEMQVKKSVRIDGIKVQK